MGLMGHSCTTCITCRFLMHYKYSTNAFSVEQCLCVRLYVWCIYLEAPWMNSSHSVWWDCISLPAPTHPHSSSKHCTSHTLFFCGFSPSQQIGTLGMIGEIFSFKWGALPGSEIMVLLFGKPSCDLHNIFHFSKTFEWESGRFALKLKPWWSASACCDRKSVLSFFSYVPFSLISCVYRKLCVNDNLRGWLRKQ